MFAKFLSTIIVSSSKYGYLHGSQAGAMERNMYVQLSRGYVSGTVLNFTCMFPSRSVLVPLYRCEH